MLETFVAYIVNKYYLVCWLGAFVLYFQLKSSGKPVIQFLPQINEKWENVPLVKFLDAMIFCLVGAIVGIILTDPANSRQAFVAGLGWTGLLSALKK